MLLAVPPFIGDHAVSGGKCAGGNGGVAHTSFGARIRIGSFVKPSAFVHQTFEAASPLMLKFIDIVAAHLVDHDNHHELWASGVPRGFGGRQLLLR